MSTESYQYNEGSRHGSDNRKVSDKNGEDILGIIPALTKKVNLLSSKTYTLVVTDKRLVFAELTKNVLLEAAK